MNYISLFSGIGGLEAEGSAPGLICEIDEPAGEILSRRFPGSELHDDVRTLEPPAAKVVAGGWPCQDISVAGLRRGLEGERSGLFFELLRVAEQAGAHTLIAENVPHLLSLEGGANFDLVLESLVASGFPYVAWRTLNAREFGLPHERRRIFIIASKRREIALALHRPLPELDAAEVAGDEGVAAFYWTAGLQSICHSPGYSPTLKVGSGLSIPSPPAVHFDGVVRKLSATEALRLQGFDPAEFAGTADKHLYRMAGNAVAAPVGRWVFASLEAPHPGRIPYSGFGYTGDAGVWQDGVKRVIQHASAPLATNLDTLIDRSDREPLSTRAAAGLLRRLVRSGKPCPDPLFELLVTIAWDELEPKYRTAIAEGVDGSPQSADRAPRTDNSAESETGPDLLEFAFSG